MASPSTLAACDLSTDGLGQGGSGAGVVHPVPPGETSPPSRDAAARAAATSALQEAIMFTGAAPPSPPRPPKMVPKDLWTPPKPTVWDPLTPKTMELLRDNNGPQARWFVQYVWGLRSRYRFALRNPQRNPLQTWQKGDRISRSHFLSRSEERAALIFDTVDPEPRPPVESRPHPRVPPPRPLPTPGTDQPTLTQFALDVDALSDGPALVVLSQELIEYDIIDSD